MTSLEQLVVALDDGPWWPAGNEWVQVMGPIEDRRVDRRRRPGPSPRIRGAASMLGHRPDCFRDGPDPWTCPRRSPKPTSSGSGSPAPSAETVGWPDGCGGPTVRMSMSRRAPAVRSTSCAAASDLPTDPPAVPSANCSPLNGWPRSPGSPDSGAAPCRGRRSPPSIRPCSSPDRGDCCSAPTTSSPSPGRRPGCGPGPSSCARPAGRGPWPTPCRRGRAAGWTRACSPGGCWRPTRPRRRRWPRWRPSWGPARGGASSGRCNGWESLSDPRPSSLDPLGEDGLELGGQMVADGQRRRRPWRRSVADVEGPGRADDGKVVDHAAVRRHGLGPDA